MPTPTPSKLTGLSNVSISSKLSSLENWGYDPPSIFSFVSVPTAPERLTTISSYENRILFTVEKGKHHFMHGIYTVRNYNEYLVSTLTGRHTASLYEFFFCFDESGVLGISPPDGNVSALLTILGEIGLSNSQLQTPSSNFGFNFVQSPDNNSFNILFPQTNSNGDFDIVAFATLQTSTVKGRITLV
tara:strand:- start:3604 stop:4164 length:561 start_codon:yes stop_codon:yes gene_type:complete